MNKLIAGLTIYAILFGSSYYGSTTAAVTLAGAIIKAKSVDNVKKYKRKDCPVCKGKGWYISGDSIKKVECGYCEPDDGAKCENGQCKTKVIKK
jgi:hypothetical protein